MIIIDRQSADRALHLRLLEERFGGIGVDARKNVDGFPIEELSRALVLFSIFGSQTLRPRNNAVRARQLVSLNPGNHEQRWPLVELRLVPGTELQQPNVVPRTRLRDAGKAR